MEYFVIYRESKANDGHIIDEEIKRFDNYTDAQFELLDIAKARGIQIKYVEPKEGDMPMSYDCMWRFRVFSPEGEYYIAADSDDWDF